MKPIIVITFMLFVCFVSCADQIKYSESDSLTKEKNRADTFLYDVPLVRQSGKLQVRKSNIEKLLGLSTLERGFDSIEIRLWFSYVFKDTSHLIVIKNKNLRWIGNLYSLKYEYSKDSVVNVVKNVQKVEPLINWNEFAQKLFNYKIMTLPDCTNIEGYQLGADGDAITVEIATPTLYRLYSYQQPSESIGIVREAEEIELIMEFIEKQFLFKRIREF